MAFIARYSFLYGFKCKTALTSVAYISSCHLKRNVCHTLGPVPILPYYQTQIINVCLQFRYQSTNDDSKQKVKNTVFAESSTNNKLSQRARLKQAIRDYGATIIVFHIAISLASLGICYIAISNGVDAVSLLKHIGFPDYIISSKVAVGSSTFVMAYAVHKLFAPARIAITLSSAPFIVRYLRKINLIKPPPK